MRKKIVREGEWGVRKHEAMAAHENYFNAC